MSDFMPKPDARGRVRVWDIPDGRYRDVFPIDAREQIQAGTACWEKPEAAEAPEGADGQQTPEQQLAAEKAAADAKAKAKADAAAAKKAAADAKAAGKG